MIDYVHPYACFAIGSAPRWRLTVMRGPQPTQLHPLAQRLDGQHIIRATRQEAGRPGHWNWRQLHLPTTGLYTTAVVFRRHRCHLTDEVTSNRVLTRRQILTPRASLMRSAMLNPTICRLACGSSAASPRTALFHWTTWAPNTSTLS